MPLLFLSAREAGLKVGSEYLTDHNRSPISISYERIESRRRMANGTLRVNYVANKMRISVSWEDVPTVDGRTVDKNRGAAFLRSLYESSPAGVFSVQVAARNDGYGDTPSFTKSMTFSSFDYEVTKRAPDFDLVNMSVEFEEV